MGQGGADYRYLQAVLKDQNMISLCGLDGRTISKIQFFCSEAVA